MKTLIHVFLQVILFYLFLNKHVTLAEENSFQFLKNQKKICQTVLLKYFSSNIQYQHIIAQNRFLIDAPNVFENKQAVFFAPINSWERTIRPNNLFTFAMRIKKEEDGYLFFKELISQINKRQNLNWKIQTHSTSTFKILNLLTARIHAPTYSKHLPLYFGDNELEISIEASKFDISIARMVFDSLVLDFNLEYTENDLSHLSQYDFKKYEHRVAWGIEVFYDWLQTLSYNAKLALDYLGGPDYKTILPYLRQHNDNPGVNVSLLETMVLELDQAIERNILPIPIKLFRATSDPYTQSLWEKLKQKPTSGPYTWADPAYLFTSFDENFAHTWNEDKLNGEGIVLEIHAHAGTKVAYLHRNDNETDYAEIILKRGQRLITEYAYYNKIFGERRLVLRVE